MKLSEGIINLTDEEKHNLRDYLSKMSLFVGHLFKSGNPIPATDFAKQIQPYSDTINKIGIDIRFVFSAYEYVGMFNKNDNAIYINLRFLTKFTLDKYDNVAYFNSIDVDELKSAIVHEYIHFKQDVLRKAKQSRYETDYEKYNKNYWKQPWEHQAYAGGYLEYLRSKLKYIKPNDILRSLKKLGFVHAKRLDDLKRTNLKAWKNIMKNAIMMTVADMSSKKSQ